MHAYHTLLQSYHELNSSQVDELSEEPSPLEFMRYVARNRPFVVRGAALQWPAVKKWNVSYLLQTMGDQQVNIAVTPYGNADAPIEQEGDTSTPRYIFVQPSEEQQPFSEFIQSITTDPSSGPVQYAQSRLYTSLEFPKWKTREYLSLFPDVLPDIDWARIALQQNPEAINLWIGTDRSTTALHKDNYQNLYVQCLGQKHFVLLPPIEGPCVNDTVMPQGVYKRSKNESGEETWHIDELTDAGDIPVAIWDPDETHKRASRYSHLSRPLRVTLYPGDMLYLPCTWYHKVTQSCGPEGICVAVNYWYDMDFEGSFHPTTTFVREVMAEVEKTTTV